MFRSAYYVTDFDMDAEKHVHPRTIETRIVVGWSVGLFGNLLFKSVNCMVGHRLCRDLAV